MSIAPDVGHHQARASAATTRVTGRRVIASIIDGLVFGAAYVLLALPFGDIESRVRRQPVRRVKHYVRLLVAAYYVLMEGYLARPSASSRPVSRWCPR